MKTTQVVLFWTYLVAIVSSYSIKFSGQWQHSYELDTHQISEEIKPSHTHVHLQMNSTKPVFVELLRGQVPIFGTLRPTTALSVSLPNTFMDFLDTKSNNSESRDMTVLIIRSKSMTAGEFNLEGLKEPAQEPTVNSISAIEIEYDLDAHSRKIYKIAGLKELFSTDASLEYEITFSEPSYFDVFWGKCGIYFPGASGHKRSLRSSGMNFGQLSSVKVLQLLADTTCSADKSADVEAVFTSYGRGVKGGIQISSKSDHHISIEAFVYSFSAAIIVFSFVIIRMKLIRHNFFGVRRHHQVHPIILEGMGLEMFQDPEPAEPADDELISISMDSNDELAAGQIDHRRDALDSPI